MEGDSTHATYLRIGVFSYSCFDAYLCGKDFPEGMKYDFYITGTIGEEFDWWTGQRGTTAEMVKDFLYRHKDQEVNIAVSSPGGFLDEGITIAEMIAAHGNCHMVIIGMTASSATVLCMKAKSVKIARGSLMLIHNSSQYILGQGLSNKKKLDAFIENLKQTRVKLDTVDKAIADFYSYRNGKTIEENMEMMDKEKWMTAQDAVDFGIVDGILEDDDAKAQTKAIQNVYASYNGIEDHFFLPKFPEFEKPAAKVPKGIMAKVKEFIRNIGKDVEDCEDLSQNDNNNNPNSIKAMKKIVLNLICAILAIQDITIGEKGDAAITEDQLNSLENALKEKDDRISALEAERDSAINDKKTAETARADAETKLANLQVEFDNFKGQAGDDTVKRPSSSSGSHEPTTAKEMYEDIKNLL